MPMTAKQFEKISKGITTAFPWANLFPTQEAVEIARTIRQMITVRPVERTMLRKAFLMIYKVSPLVTMSKTG